jgi:hypothetical protein
MTGKRSPKRTRLGDDEFERSRGPAQEAYNRLLKQMREDRTGAKALTKLAELKSGRKVSFPKLADLPELWDQIPRRKAPNATYAERCKVKLARFAEFAAKKQRTVRLRGR